MQTKPTSEFPDPVDRIQLGAIGWQVVQCELCDVLFAPLPMEPGVVVLGIVGDHHHATVAAKAGLVKSFHKFKKGQAVELVRLPAKLEPPIAQSHGAKYPTLCRVG